MCVPRGAVTNSAESFGSKCPQSLGGSPQGVSRVLHKKEILAKGAHPAPERCMKTASTSQNVDRLKKNPGTSRQTFRGRTLLNIMAQCKGKSVLPSSTFPLFLQAHGMAASCIADAQSNPTLHHATWAPISSPGPFSYNVGFLMAITNFLSLLFCFNIFSISVSPLTMMMRSPTSILLSGFSRFHETTEPVSLSAPTFRTYC
mmetsp:Transcript_2297/g.6635  ORF Transcript_2297/g.6635 Transcript_2297/m.6635 type:complete len:202 (-) Transcript_2297:392-997(-)